MKPFKLTFHQKTQQNKTYSGEDIAICSKEASFLKENDIVEITIPDAEDKEIRVVLKITKGSLREDFTQKDTISIDQTIVAGFQLKSFIDVTLHKVDPQFVELDSVELTFKDQYLGRSEMWRLKNSLESSCLFVGKKIEFCSSTIRCQVYELWSSGVKVFSGLVTQSTKIVFRSSTSMVYLFIQMSSEMWEFDIYGDLYFEKSVNGFLSELFAKWKKNGSNHEVTIVMFSRLYYLASSLDQFPDGMRECLLSDYKGRFYEDFYKVVIQNEKYEDWRNTLINLRHAFVGYYDYLLNFHKKKHSNSKVPRATISSAAQGNFLEVLNMSLNVFEKHFVDRSFDRTGQLSIVITPGVGVFEVDRDLTNVTMQRVIDNGVGSDLVCVGEQPLHAVPLLKFHNKATHHNDIDDYSMPHWINLSFYSTDKRVGYATYVPRIKLPTRTISYPGSLTAYNLYWKHKPSYAISAKRLGDETVWPNSIYDFENYDDNIFKPSSNQLLSKKRNKHIKRFKNVSELDITKMFVRQNSEPEMHAAMSVDLYSSNSNNSSLLNISSSLVLPPTQPSSAIMIPSKLKLKQSENIYSSSFGALNIEMKPKLALTPNKDDIPVHRQPENSSPSMSSYGGSPKEDIKGKFSGLKRPSKSLINPFDPSHAVIKLTSNRRRWTHIFPRGPTGNLIQHHHFSCGLSKLDIVPECEVTIGTTDIIDNQSSKRNTSCKSFQENSPETHSLLKVQKLWGATGEQEWTPTLTTGVDWKSMTIPACLPLTTDYFPDERSLKTDYLVSDYSLLPDDVNADYSSQRAVYRRPLTTREVLTELVSQRLAQGFQSVIRNKPVKPPVKPHSSLVRLNSIAEQESKEQYFLSIGRIFHEISLSTSTITVTRYRPRHPYPAINIHYKYRFHAPNNNFEISYANFSTEKLENYNWNYLDHYICTRGDRDFALTENLKYWRFRMFILPINQGVLKKLMGDVTSPCDIYEEQRIDEKRTLIQEFLKFIETCINRIRRPNNSVPKGPARGPSGGSQGSTSSLTGFRERVNSNHVSERPRIRSGSKLIDKQRQESGNGRISPLECNFDSKTFPTNLESLMDLQNSLPSLSRGDVGGTETPCGSPAIKHLKADASYQDIVTSMRGQNTGFTFIKSCELPNWTFVSYDAVMWLVNHMEGIVTDSQAIEILTGMLKDKLILHASGDSNHEFVNGFYLYYIIQNDSDGLTLEPLIPLPHGDSSLFHNEWMEIEVPAQNALNMDVVKYSLLDEGSPEEMNDIQPDFKDVYVDVDVSKKSDRQEWGHVRYQSVYKPDEAFEITAQWIQATGAIITDLVQGWSRKAQQCNLVLVPVPTDPFALPSSNNSDPLRGPISIELNITVLLDKMNQPKDFNEEEMIKKLTYFQHVVALKFGFVRSPKHAYTPTFFGHRTKQSCLELHYVHTSGNMFIIIPNIKSLKDAEFLWSWNYMVSKRWRTSATPALGDDPFMFKVLNDLVSFAKNDDNRLVDSWDSVFLTVTNIEIEQQLTENITI